MVDVSVCAGHASFAYKGCVYVHGGEVSVEGGVTRLPASRGSVTSLLPSEAGTVRSCTEDMHKLDCGELETLGVSVVVDDRWS